jgi:hypothetical protein
MSDYERFFDHQVDTSAGVVGVIVDRRGFNDPTASIVVDGRRRYLTDTDARAIRDALDRALQIMAEV